MPIEYSSRPEWLSYDDVIGLWDEGWELRTRQRPATERRLCPQCESFVRYLTASLDGDCRAFCVCDACGWAEEI